MTVLERVQDLILRHAPAPLCDDCIADRLHLTVPQHANHKTRELAEKPGFNRRIAVCALCRGTKKVIGYGERVRRRAVAPPG